MIKEVIRITKEFNFTNSAHYHFEYDYEIQDPNTVDIGIVFSDDQEWQVLVFKNTAYMILSRLQRHPNSFYATKEPFYKLEFIYPEICKIIMPGVCHG